MRTLLATVAAATLLSSVGCAGKYDSTYNVLIDPTFSSSDTDSIVSAFAAWTHIAGDGMYLSFNVSIGDPGQCAGKPTSHQICIHSTTITQIQNEGAPENVLGFTRPYTDGGGEIYIPVSVDSGLSADQLTTVVAHEVGHAMGLSHTSDSSSNVMYSGFSHVANLPTCSDFQQYIDLRGGTEFGSNSVCPSKYYPYSLSDGKEGVNR